VATSRPCSRALSQFPDKPIRRHRAGMLLLESEQRSPTTLRSQVSLVPTPTLVAIAELTPDD